MKIKLFISAGIVAIIALVISGGIYYKNSRYTYVQPKKGSIVEAIYGMGTVKTDSKFEVKLGIMAKVEELYVKEGMPAKKDQKLVKIDNGVTFRSPIDGVVTYVGFQQNETALPQVPILKVEDIGERYLEISLEQQGALRVKEGQIADVLFESLRGEKYQGIVRAIYPRQGEFIVHVDVKELSKNILPGMTADIAIKVGEIENALLVPVSSIDNGKIVRKRNDKKSKIEVKVGKVDGSWAEILSDNLTVDDLVLIPKKKK